MAKIFPGESRRDFEKLICIRSVRWWREYDYWVVRQHRIMPVKTLHYVRPRHVHKAIIALQENAVHPWPVHRLDPLKKGEKWRP